jgi:hypothetical protein
LSAVALVAGAAAGSSFDSEMALLFGAGASFFGFQILWAIWSARRR